MQPGKSRTLVFDELKRYWPKTDESISSIVINAINMSAKLKQPIRLNLNGEEHIATPDKNLILASMYNKAKSK